MSLESFVRQGYTAKGLAMHDSAFLMVTGSSAD
jgi:hypothetical protein